MSSPANPWPLSLPMLLAGVVFTGAGLVLGFSDSGRLAAWTLAAAGLVLLALELRKYLICRQGAKMMEMLKHLALEESGPDGGSGSGEEDANVVRSLVFLLEEPRDLSDGAWVAHLSEALSVPLNAEGDESTNFTIPMPHPELTPRGDDCWMLGLPEGKFWLLNVKRTYVDDVEGWVQGARDNRLRDAVLRHKAWLSVDLLMWDGEFNREEAYAVIGRCIAALAGPDVLAVLCPELGRCNEFDPGLLPRLSGGEPLKIFESPTFAPVIQVRSDNEQMEAAVADARRHWPEFVEAFAGKTPGDERPFIVKAPFTEADQTEYMWVIVAELADGMVRGTLANQPHHLESFHEGQRVEFPDHEIWDFLCIGKNGQRLGGWTQRVLQGG